MGYWVCKNTVVHTAKVHRDSSASPNCRWRGAREGMQKPDSWEHFETLPTGTTTVGNKTVLYIPCAIRGCMNNNLEP